MADELLRRLEREAVLSNAGAASLTKELRRRSQAFEECDACWGAGFRLVAGSLERCSFCFNGSPKAREDSHIADERRRRPSDSHWRDQSVRMVSATLEALPRNATEKECRAALRNAYPFGQRAYHPYKIWCDEVKKQLRRRFGTDEAAPLLQSLGADPQKENAS